MRPGTTIVVDVERPAVGGRMIARHEGRIVFVAGTIPGERVEARVERVQRQAGWAETTRVLTASPDRVEVPAGLGCGGQVLAHVTEPRQRALKAEMLADALRRIGRIPLDAPIPMHGGPADGYRTRARIHLRDRRAGFFEEGSHHLCDLAASRQLTPASVDAIARLTAALVSAAPGLEAELEWAEDVPGSMRAVHVTVASGRDAGAVTALEPRRWPRRPELRGGGRTPGRWPAGVGCDPRRRPRARRRERPDRHRACGAGVLPGQPLPAAASGRRRRVAARRSGARPLRRRRPLRGRCGRGRSPGDRGRGRSRLGRRPRRRTPPAIAVSSPSTARWRATWRDRAPRSVPS